LQLVHILKSQRVAVCYSVLPWVHILKSQRVAVYCGVLQLSVLQCCNGYKFSKDSFLLIFLDAASITLLILRNSFDGIPGVLQCVAVCCSVLQCDAVCCRVLPISRWY